MGIYVWGFKQRDHSLKYMQILVRIVKFPGCDITISASHRGTHKIFVGFSYGPLSWSGHITLPIFTMFLHRYRIFSKLRASNSYPFPDSTEVNDEKHYYILWYSPVLVPVLWVLRKLFWDRHTIWKFINIAMGGSRMPCRSRKNFPMKHRKVPYI